MNRFRLSLLILLILPGVQAQALEILHVRQDREMLDSGGKSPLDVRFELSAAAHARMDIYDSRDLLIRRIEATGKPAAGEHVLRWDGRDNAGHPVPAGAYHYTLQATGADGSPVVYDLSDITGGENLEVKNIHWDSKQKTIGYLLQKPARVNIRIGLKDNGPLLRVLLDWVPRSAGTHQEPWDGMDASGVIDLSRHPKRDIVVLATSLSDNTVLVGPPVTTERMIQDRNWGRQERQHKKTTPRRVAAVSRQPVGTRGNFALRMTLPEGTERNADGIDIVGGRVAVRLDVDDKDRKRAVDRRFEAGFYVDGLLVFENETGFLPMTWYWDTKGINPGIHYLTSNLRGYEGNFGMQTLKLYVRPKGEQR
jgi:hypothetical protein